VEELTVLLQPLSGFKRSTSKGGEEGPEGKHKGGEKREKGGDILLRRGEGRKGGKGRRRLTPQT